jgi:hypothetical protein
MPKTPVHLSALGLILGLALVQPSSAAETVVTEKRPRPASQAPSATPDIPAVGLDRLSWGATAGEIKAAYPALGGAPVEPDVRVAYEDPALRTDRYPFAGCRYEARFFFSWDETRGDRLAAVILTLLERQPRTCAPRAVSALTARLGKPGKGLKPDQLSWGTSRTTIFSHVNGSGPQAGRFSVAFHNRAFSPLLTVR